VAQVLDLVEVEDATSLGLKKLLDSLQIHITLSNADWFCSQQLHNSDGSRPTRGFQALLKKEIPYVPSICSRMCMVFALCASTASWSAFLVKSLH